MCSAARQIGRIRARTASRRWSTRTRPLQPQWTELPTIVDSLGGPWHGGDVTELNATSAALLGLLHDGPKTGGQLVAAATERFGGFFSVTRSQVYRELPALTESGLLRLGKQ